MDISTKVSVYDILIAVGLVFTGIRMASQYRVVKRIRAALHDAEADVEKLKRKHPVEGTVHQPVYSPGEGPVTKENP
jgi:hypothetical protein